MPPVFEREHTMHLNSSSLLPDAYLCGAQNPAGLFLLHEDYRPQVVELAVFLKRYNCVSGEGRLALRLCVADLAPGLYHPRVRLVAAAAPTARPPGVQS